MKVGSSSREIDYIVKPLLCVPLLWTLLVCCMAGGADVQELAAAPPVSQAVLPKPKVQIDNPTFEFGSVNQGSKVVYDFTIRNVGTADLLVQRVVPACGCTAASSSSAPIPAGAEGKIHVEFDTKGFSGEKLKTIRVYTNDVDDPSQLLTLKGIVEPDVRVEPRSIFFDDVVRGTSPEKEVIVEVRSGAPMTIDSIKSFSKYIQLKELESSPNRRKISIVLSQETPVGELRERLIVSLRGKGSEGRATAESSVNVPIFAAIKGHLVLKPAQLSFGVLEGTDTLVRTVRLENMGEEPISIKQVRSNSDAVHGTFKEVERGRKFDIQISVEPQKVSRDLRASVDVITDREDEESLSLNVYGILPPKV